MSLSSWSKSSSSSIVSTHDVGSVGELRHSIRHNLKKLLPRQLRARRRARESKHLYRRVYTRHKKLIKTFKKRKRPAQSSNGDRPPRAETLSTEVFDRVVEFREHQSTLNLLSRLAETRIMLTRIQGAHGDLDSLFRDAELTRTNEMTEWRDCWHRDLTQYVSNVRTLLTTAHHHESNNNNTNVSEMNRVLTNISYEVQFKRVENGTEVVVLLEWALERMTRQRNVAIPSVYLWYIPPYDVEWTPALFDMGSRSTLYQGTLERSTKVVVKRLFESHGQQQPDEAFVREAEVWSSLRHPHVLTLHGACHLATPPFFICEDAGERRNFVDYFSEDCPDRQQQQWRLLYEAALGIQYLHQENIVHDSIKCRNLLVGADSKARLCGFGSSMFVAGDQRSSRQESPFKNVRWASREVLIDSAPPGFASDMFSLGMAIIEAVSGDIPWRALSDDEVICSVRDRMQHDRPEGFTDKQWSFVQALCDYNSLTRMTMDDAIESLGEFMREKEAGEPESEAMSKNAVEVLEDSIELEKIPSWLAADSEYKALFSVFVSRLEELQNALTSEKQPPITREQRHAASSKHNSIARRFQDADVSMMQSSERISNVLEVLGLICIVKTEVDELATVVDLSTHHDWESRWASVWKAKSDQLLSEYESRLGKLCPEMRENESAARFQTTCLGEILRCLLTPATMRIRLELAAADTTFDSICTQLLAFMEKHSVRKNILYRIASSRWVAAELQIMQQSVFELARTLPVACETISEWEQQWRELIMIRASSLEIQLDQQNNILDLLPDRSSQEEALVLLKFELDKRTDANPQETDPPTNLVEKALTKATEALKLDVQNVPEWFIPPYELTYDDSCLGQGSFGSTHLGSWRSNQRVVVKILPVGGLGSARANATFMDEVGKWESLDHYHILKLHGAAHVGTKPFLVLDYAEHGNLLQYLDIPENRPKIAQLFHQAAQALAYLHSQEIVHGHLRCCNILVSGQGDEVVKLSDFGFGSVRSAVNALGGSNVTNSIQWMASEHFEMEEAGPSYVVDVFSLGMCVVEALVRGPPWGEMDEMDVLDNILDGNLPPRPSDAPPEIWELVVHILQDRLALGEVITRLEELASKEQHEL